jgi:hypothetical protein
MATKRFGGQFSQALLSGVLMGGACLFASLPADAALPSSKPSAQPSAAARPESAISLEATKSALGLPLANRMQVLLTQGEAGYRNLVNIMFDASASMDHRWRAVTAAGRIGGEEATPELARALKSKDWYMRNAALVSMSGINRDKAIEWARLLLSDKALLVRASAVQTLAALGDRSSASILWEKLYAKENFRGKHSLFIRRRILETLAKIESPGREQKFIEALNDSDETLHSVAVGALERMTNKKLGAAKDTVRVKRGHWQQWWKEQSHETL